MLPMWILLPQTPHLPCLDIPSLIICSDTVLLISGNLRAMGMYFALTKNLNHVKNLNISQMQSIQGRIDVEGS